MPPFVSVHWRVFLRTRDQRKLDRATAGIADALGHPLANPTLARCYKDHSATELTFRTPLPATTPAEAVFGVLVQARGLAHHWTTFGPLAYEEDVWEFELMCTERFTVPRVTWANCSTSNSPAPHTETSLRTRSVAFQPVKREA